MTRVYQGSDLVGFYQYIRLPNDHLHYDSIHHYKAAYSIASFSDDQMVWRQELAKNTDDIFLTDPGNNKIIAGKKGIHILRSNLARPGRSTIEHVLISYDGKYEKIDTPLWNDKYVYFFQDAVETDDSGVIMGCLQGTTVRFVKMVLE